MKEYLKNTFKRTLALLMTLSLMVGFTNFEAFKSHADYEHKIKIRFRLFVDEHDENEPGLKEMFGDNLDNCEFPPQIVKDGDILKEPTEADIFKMIDVKQWTVGSGDHKKIVEFERPVTIVGGEEWGIPTKNDNKYYTQGFVDQILLYGEFEIKPFFKLSFDSNGGSPSYPDNVYFANETIKSPGEPQKDGYKFVGWEFSEGAFAGQSFNFNRAVHEFKSNSNAIRYHFDYNSETNKYKTIIRETNTGEVTKLKAVYEKLPEDVFYNVEFNTDGGSPIPEVQKIKAGAVATEPSAPNKEGYIFDGWYFDNVKLDFQNTPIEKNITIYAKYSKEESKEVTQTEEPKIFTVSFDSKGGSPEPESQSVEENSKAKEPNKDPFREGYSFEGWYDAKGKFDFNSIIERDTILYANYSKEGSSHDKSKRKDIDVDDKDYDKAIIKYKDAFFKGYPDKTFKPEATISRAEMATVFVRLLGIENNKLSSQASYSDIKGHWAEKNIMKASEYGILKGYPDGTFNPSGKMKRGEIASVINNYWKIKDFTPNSENANITDIQNHWAKKLILALYNHRFVDLYQDNTFKPNSPLKRADVAQILNRITDRKLTSTKKEKFIDVKKSHWAFEEVSTASSPVK